MGALALQAIPMDKISRRHPPLNRTLLRLQFASQGLKCHELLVQDTSYFQFGRFGYSLIGARRDNH